MGEARFRFVGSRAFWTWFLPTLAVTGAFFAWELKLVMLPVANFTRLPATPFELAYTALLTLLLALAMGLFGWRRAHGSCPVGVKRTVGAAGVLGGLALLCPVCLALPVAFLGTAAFFATVAAFLPLIRLLAILFAAVAVYLLWPEQSVTAPKNGRG